jgi:hypothetical protein
LGDLTLERRLSDLGTDLGNSLAGHDRLLPIMRRLGIAYLYFYTSVISVQLTDHSVPVDTVTVSELVHVAFL